MLSSTPWIIAILSIMILSLFIGNSPNYHQIVVQFQITITYLVAGSLIISGVAQHSFSRFVADELYVNNTSSIIPNVHGIICLVSTLAGCLSFVFVLCFFPLQSIVFRFLFIGCFVTLSNLWIIINLLTGLKDYTIIILAFIVSYTSIVLLGFLLRHLGLEGLLFSYFFGQLELIALLMSALYYQYPANKTIEFHFLKKNKMYKILMVSGLCFNLAVWVDKFVFWYTPITSHHIIGPLRSSLFYDVPIFIAYLTVTPGMAVLFFLVETNFSEYYLRFHEAIRDGQSLRYIQIMRDQMINHAYQVIYAIVKIQTVTLILVFQMGDEILTLFHISTIYKNLLFIDVIGTSFQVILLAILNLLYYMDRKEETLLLTILFFVLNLSLSILSIQIGPFYYGFGFTSALIITCTYGMYLLEKQFCDLEYKLIMLRK